jgi:hypothetical protein
LNRQRCYFVYLKINIKYNLYVYLYKANNCRFKMLNNFTILSITIIKIVLFFMMGNAITSCSLKPIYSEEVTNISKIKIGQITSSAKPSKTDFIFKKSLEGSLLQENDEAKPEYLLNIKLSGSKQSIVIQSNSISSRIQMNLIADYTLIDINTGLEVVSDKAIDIESFEITSSPYSNQISEEETLNLLARNIVNEIKFRLIHYI